MRFQAFERFCPVIDAVRMSAVPWEKRNMTICVQNKTAPSRRRVAGALSTVSVSPPSPAPLVGQNRARAHAGSDVRPIPKTKKAPGFPGASD